MTTEAAVAFVERLKSDEALRAKLAGLESPAERLALARAEGFDLTADDGPAVERALGPEELADKELEQVVGGIFGPPPTDPSGSTIFVN
ncbi:MAG TPA: Nif11-like leader peptide family RiPP precursor [Gaiellaceae bacterium]|nr:Nif11-like leader peptide family RiPP precursor [Gaiellaceae bacterium]